MPNDVAFEIYYDGAWHDLVAGDDVFADTPIVITRGDGDESAAPRPAALSAKLANDDDMFRTSNPMSPLYGKAGVNTPTRVSVGSTVRGHVEASSWKASQTRDFRSRPKRGKAWVDVEGGGLLQRVNQWTEPLKSPFRQYNETITQAIGYFHMEQARGSTTLESTIPGTTAAGFSGFAFDSQYRPPGSAPLMDVGQDAELGHYFVPSGTAASTAGWQLSWVARYEPLNGEQYVMNWDTMDGTAYSMTLNATDGKLYIYSSLNGTPVLNVGQSYSGYNWNQWTLFSLDAQQIAGPHTNIYINWTNFDNTESGFLSVGFDGVSSALRWWSVTGITGDVPAGSTMGHLLAVNVDHTGVDLFSADRIAAWTGHLGELAAVRFGRLCDLKGVPYYVSTSWAQSYPMGPQPVDTFPNLLKEIRDTEDGLIYDHRTEIRLYFLCRADRYNQDPALTLNAADPDASGLPNLPDEVNDDLPIHNLVTVSQRDGGDYTVEDSTSPMGTQSPPDGRGEYRQTVDVNTSDPDTDLPLLAGWWLNRGTVDLPRYPKVTVNLAALDASKVAEVEQVDVGSVIEITNYREYTIRLFVIGYTETIWWPNARQIVFTCAPDRQFDVDVYDTARYDSASTTTGAAYPPSATSIVFSTTNSGDVWSTTETPYNCHCAGEEFTVTTMGAVSGTGPYLQTATVRRGANGIVKTLPSGEEIHVATPGRYAL